MYNYDTEVVFPDRIIPDLINLRGQTWQALIEQICANPHFDENRLAFVLFMARLCGCATCQADSFQALRGCLLCAQRTLHRYTGSDESLVECHRSAKLEVHQFLESKSILEKWNVA